MAKLHVPFTVAALALGSLAMAGTPTLTATTVTPRAHDTAARDWTDAIKDALTVYDNKDTFIQKVRFSMMTQFQVADVQPSGGNGHKLKEPASPVNQEFRRVWLGVNVDFASGTQFHTWVRPGGLPMRETYGTRTVRNFSYTNFFDIWVKQDISAVKGLSVKVGKIKPLFSTEYSTSSSAIKTVERSFVANQFGLDSNWGVDVTYEPSKQDKVYVQLFANDRAPTAKSNGHGDCYRDGRGFKGEFGWEDQCYGIVGAAHKFGQTSTGWHQVSGQYMHDFNNAYSRGNDKGNNCYGPGFQDALSLGYDYKQGPLTITTNAVFSFNPLDKAAKGNHNMGIVIMPVYALNPHVDLVFRYTGMTGHGACKLGADRYIGTQCLAAEAPTWVDSLHAFYIGADVYASAKNPNAAKLMFGAEYVHTRDHGDGGYCGWEFSTAARLMF